VSTVPEVLAAIAVLGAATLPTYQVVNGPYGSVTVTKGQVFWVADEDFEIQREPDSLAGVTATEEYVVPCGVDASVPTPDQSVADAQAWAAYEALEAAIIANPHLGLSAAFSLHATIIGTQTFRRLPDQNGRYALVRFGLHVFATTN
jgi:hypothetical protein